MTNKVFMGSFEEYARKLIRDYQIPGVSIGLNQGGKSVYYQGLGYRDIDNSLPVTGDTVFGIASITKSFTGVAIMKLQEAGKLSVHDEVVDHLPEFKTTDPERTAQMTIHHFLTNSSGLPPLPSLIYANKRSMDKDPSKDDYPGLTISENVSQGPIDTYEELMNFIGKLDFELLGSPGQHFSYSNDAFALLGAIIERASGQSYESFVKDNILVPAGMRNTTFDLNDLNEHDDITMLYASKEMDGKTNVYSAPVWWDAPAMRPAGYLKSTVHDMLKYTEIYRNKGVVNGVRIISEKSVKQMIYPYIEAEPGKYYGYGLMITPDYYGNTLIEHGGNLKAIASFMCIIPEKGVTGVVLTNLAGVPATSLLMGALNDFQSREVTASHKNLEEVDISLEQLQKYVGTYTSNEGMQVTIGVKDGKLTCFTQGSYHSIRCVGEDIFVVQLKDQEETIRFITDHNGKVDRIGYHFRQFPKSQE
ncbi:serine hydrolase [Ornithinibacillus sp. L9]|uniref:Serine hydrolase n=1 Tax=Ornithinibacillus caprae TaxID=2678566 RepID=A0A6N8FHY5_9BACI|nr:serine hydrolase [Ornithinibacillus caprae]MUK87667.1 serine hydrolase [Ornithinibacillus caprae]